MQKCSTCKFWSAAMRRDDELGRTAWCLNTQSPHACNFVPCSNGCEHHEAGPADDDALVVRSRKVLDAAE